MIVLSAARVIRRRFVLPALCAGALVALLLAAAGASAETSMNPALHCRIAVTATASGQPVDSIALGDDVTLTATIWVDSGDLPTGTVTFATDLGGIDGYVSSFSTDGSNGTAILKTRSLPSGSYGITATYDNGTDFCITDPAPMSTSEPAGLVTTTTTLELEPSTFSSSTDTIVFKATVVQNGASVDRPGGKVTFKIVDGNGANGFDFGSADLQSDGTATYSRGGFTPGTYTFQATYTGDINFDKSFGLATLTSDATSAIAYTGPATAGAGEHATLRGRLTDGTAGIGGKPVTLSIRGATGSTCSATTDGSGNAACDVVVNRGVGTATVDLAFAGDDAYGGSTGTGALTIVPGQTTVAYTGDSRGSTGRPVQLAATLLTSAGDPIANQPVTLTLNGAETCTPRTDTDGVAACLVTAHELPGTYPVTAHFPGSADYLPGDAPAATIDVVASVPTSIDWAGSTTVAAGMPGTIAFLLASDGTPVAGEDVAITYDDKTQTVTTDANGVATWPDTVTRRLGGSVAATAAFAGAPGYDPSKGSGSFTVSPADATLALDPVAPVVRTDPVTLSATLTAGGGGVPNEHLTLSLGAQSCPTGLTDQDGRASCTIPSVTAPLGPAATAASFAGDAQATSAHASGTTTIVPIPTTLVLASVAPVQVGQPATLSARLTRTGAGPIAGETVTLSLGSQQCSDTTQSSGLATCTIPHITQQASKQPVSADLAADETYAHAHADGSTIVYDFAPGGFFAVAATPHAGDAVTFWGAQWAKRNPIDAPSSFKGFVGTATTPTCGATWTTRPGNSTPPPDGPLPQYMAVVASSTIAKKGSAITGDVQSVVIVQTSAGYASDPGHAGTGVVVTTICG